MKIRNILLVASLVLVLAAGCGKSDTLEGLEEWDLVYISDNSGLGVPYVLPDLIEKDTGKTIVLHNYVIEELSALVVLEELRGGTSNPKFQESLEGLQEAVAEAEMIVFFAGNYDDIEGMDHDSFSEDLWACFAHWACTLPVNCTHQAYQPYTDVIRQVFEEMLYLRDGKPTIIRALDFYNPRLQGQRDCGSEMESACIQCVETFNDSYRTAAEAHNVPLVSIYDLFNGPNHDEDPKEKGYLGNSGFFPSKEGFQAIAELIAAAGYEPVNP